jgi:Zn-dependent protease with chaperone function
MRRTLLHVLCILLLCAGTALGKDVKIHGFVTTVNSPTNFEIDDYKINRDMQLVLEVEKDESGGATASFNPEDIRVGTELEIRGDWNESTGELKAKSIKVFLDDTGKIKRTALVHEVPVLKKTDSGAWIGFVKADGQRVAISESTVVTVKLNKSERKQSKSEKSEAPKEDSAKLVSADYINQDTFMHYEGTRQPDGSVLASKVEFDHAELEAGELKLWRQLTPKVKEANFTSSKPGELRVARSKYKLVPDKEAQEYVNRVGLAVKSSHQRELSADNPLKVPFTFYLVEDKSCNASAYPNGVVVVHSGLFDVLENEAQLEFVLSHEVTHSIEKHVWREHEYHKTALMALRIGGAIGAGFGGRGIADIANMVEAGIRNGYARSLENQADREGMERMLEAGYDPREAPRAWKAVAKKYGDRPTNLFWDNHDNNATRRSYLMSELKNNYSETEFSSLKKDGEEYHRISERIRNLTPDKKKVKVKVRQ